MKQSTFVAFIGLRHHSCCNTVAIQKAELCGPLVSLGEKRYLFYFLFCGVIFIFDLLCNICLSFLFGFVSFFLLFGIHTYLQVDAALGEGRGRPPEVIVPFNLFVSFISE